MGLMWPRPGEGSATTWQTVVGLEFLRSIAVPKGKGPKPWCKLRQKPGGEYERGRTRMRTEYKDTYYYIYVASGGPMGWIFFLSICRIFVFNIRYVLSMAK
jgi:hypothetical protein